MKLEFKYIAPYLPYNLMIQGQTNGEIAEMSCITETSVNITSRNFQFGMWADLFDIKLILRPLSDLNRYGEDIINEHSINLLISEKHGLDYGVFIYYDGKMDIELDGDPDLRYDVNKRISFDVMFTIQEELLKGHYDIHKLIENNLAIDINTIK